ncbi:MAG TPA: PTS sugar transporter subunit IIA [Spirochaetia bacterium]|nr:PTS sugar transporter subunit IIA [Spirochaetaceae bacterium]HPE88645.1 PTS sugar transporter subunit IIA [Spirochaetales bacterium]HRW23484.1 PTS sugar transporter subunit IIA [Spirochaetia bacterium]
MSLSTTLSEETAAVSLRSKDKQGIINELLDLLVAAGAVTDKPAALKAVLDRERKMSTGMKYGIAIPHGKTDSVSALVACVGVSAEPVPFDSLDGEPSRIFIMTLSPPEKTGPHLQFLAEVSQLFKSEAKRAAAVAARTPAELLSVITR